MQKVKVSVRLPEHIKDALYRFDNPSAAARSFICAGLRHAKAPHRTEVKELIALKEEIRRIGVNLNQLVRKLNADGISDTEQIKRLCEELSVARQRILKLLKVYHG